ncbi:MAG TPA: hypothetical protein VFA97_06665 [Gaiellaceae bacterium]|nr:hypothetical protein [Gaiellaceae bacterium]
MRIRVAIVVALRAVLIALLVYGVARQSLPQYHDKAMAVRLVVYPLLTCVVPLVWLARGRPGRYPFDVDGLVVIPFLFDSAGNATNLYDRIWWWDKVEHSVNWFVLVGAVALVLARTTVRTPELVGLAIGFGAVTAILWELGEYVSFIRSNKTELHGAYTNTLGDLLWGLTGSTVAAVTVAWATRRASPARVR